DADLRRSNRLYVVDVESGARRSIADGLLMSSPAWSPRGDLIAFVAPSDLEAGRLERVWVAPADGGRPRCLTASLDRSVGDTVLSDMRGGHSTNLRWSDDGERVYFLVSGPGTAELCSVGLDGGVAVEVPADRRTLYDFDVSGGSVAVCAAD